MENNSKTLVLICIDAGGTKTRINLYNLNGEVLYTEVIGVGSPAITKDLEFTSIDEALTRIFAEFKDEYIFKNITMGISGLGVHPDVEYLVKKFENKFNCKVIILNDALIALYAVAGSCADDIINNTCKESILILGGTGSAICGIKNGKTLLVGGWGHIIGEYGSAYSLVHHACLRLIQRFEKNLELLPLDKLILNVFGIDNPFKLKSIFYLKTKGEIASKAHIITDMANKGDKEAISIIKEEASLIVDGVIRLVNKQNIENGAILGFKGGLFKNNQLIIEFVQKILSDKDLYFKVIVDDKDPIIGAYFLAKAAYLLEV